MTGRDTAFFYALNTPATWFAGSQGEREPVDSACGAGGVRWSALLKRNMEPQWLDFPVLGDRRGQLIPMEAQRSVPFEIKRVYALVALQPGGVRGAHAHRTLNQVIVALAGSCRVSLDDGRTCVDALMDAPGRGLVLDPMVWHEMSDFSPDCVLLVLASDYYDEADYIRNRSEFLRLTKKVEI